MSLDTPSNEPGRAADFAWHLHKPAPFFDDEDTEFDNISISSGSSSTFYSPTVDQEDDKERCRTVQRHPPATKHDPPDEPPCPEGSANRDYTNPLTRFRNYCRDTYNARQQQLDDLNELRLRHHIAPLCLLPCNHTRCNFSGPRGVADDGDINMIRIQDIQQEGEETLAAERALYKQRRAELWGFRQGGSSQAAEFTSPPSQPPLSSEQETEEAEATHSTSEPPFSPRPLHSDFTSDIWEHACAILAELEAKEGRTFCRRAVRSLNPATKCLLRILRQLLAAAEIEIRWAHRAYQIKKHNKERIAEISGRKDLLRKICRNIWGSKTTHDENEGHFVTATPSITNQEEDGDGDGPGLRGRFNRWFKGPRAVHHRRSGLPFRFDGCPARVQPVIPLPPNIRRQLSIESIDRA